MGAHCDLCKPGFYNLQQNNPLGCTDCFCFGVSDVCESSAWSTTQVSVIHLHTRATTAQQVRPGPDALLLFRCFTRMLGSSPGRLLGTSQSSRTMTYPHLATLPLATPTRMFCCGMHLTVSLVTRCDPKLWSLLCNLSCPSVPVPPSHSLSLPSWAPMEAS